MASRWFGVATAEDGDGDYLRIEPAAGVGLLGVTKAFDAGTTAFALAYVPWIEEGNPVVAAAFEAVGTVPGIVALSVLGVVGLASCTESLAASVDEPGERYANLVRLIGYVPASALFFLLGVQNAVLVLTGASLLAL